MKKLIVSIAAIVLVAACTSSVTSGNRTASATSQSASRASDSAPQTTADTTVESGSASEATETPSSPSRASSTSSTLDACLHYTGHVFEVCTAYIANSSLAVLVPYYKYAKSPQDSLARYVAYRLGSRYTGQANTVITNRVAAWPAGTHEVSVPIIKILSARSSLQTNTATLVTQETWKVTSQGGSVIYRENGKRHTVTLHRVQSYVLHKWVVTNLQ